jgi:glycosyltransferase involved in cell wall biosynthesis
MTEGTPRESAGKLLAINQSVSTYFRDLADGMAAQGLEVTLLAGYLELTEGYTPPFEWIRGCELRRSPAWRRLWTWGKFTLQAMRAMIRHRKGLVLLVTNPPLVPWVAPMLRRLFGVRYIELIYDIYPDVMGRMGMLRAGGRMYRFLRHLSSRAHRRAECVITLGRCMRQTVLGQLDDPAAVEVHVIPNWANIEEIRPRPRQDNPFSIAQGLTDKFVVMYSGAFGATHDIDSIVLAAEQLLDLGDLQIVLIGGGTREAEVRRLVEQKALPNLRLLPRQPVDQVKFLLTAADCQIVCLDEGFEGVSVPSKTYNALAAGTAILAVSPPDTELTDLVAEHDCGIWLPPRDVAGLAAAIRKLHDDRPLLARMQANSRRAAVEHYSKGPCVEQYVKLLMPLFRA